MTANRDSTLFILTLTVTEKRLYSDSVSEPVTRFCREEG